MFVGKVRSLPYSGAHFRCSNQVCSSHTHKLQTRGQCYKTFLVRDLRIFILSQSVCYTRLKKLARYKTLQFLQKFVNYRQKKFYNIGPRLEGLARDHHSSLLRTFVNYALKYFDNIGCNRISYWWLEKVSKIRTSRTIISQIVFLMLKILFQIPFS